MKILNISLIKCILISWIICFALVRFLQISTSDPLSLICYFMCILGINTYYSKIHQSAENLNYRYISRFLSCVFATLTTFGGVKIICLELENTVFKLVVFCLSYLGFLFMYYFICSSLIYFSNKFEIRISDPSKLASSYKALPAIAFVCCILFWLPAFFTNFPGIMTIDSINQYGQAIGALSPSNHHPFFHTLCIRMCVLLGNLLGSRIVGIAIYSISQMLFSAFVISYLIKTFTDLHIKKAFIWFTIFFFTLIPYHGYMMVTMWKDIPFSFALLLFSTCLFRLCVEDISSVNVTPLTYILFVISGVGVGLLRSNGFYIIIIMIPLLLISFRKNRFKLGLLSAVLILSVLIVKYPIYNMMNVSEPDFSENLSIPLQTMGRVFADGVASNAEKTAWNRYIDVASIPDYYYSNVSDNMKSLLKSGNSEYFKTHKLEFLKLWIITGIHHPIQYLSAWGDITRGYWFPDTTPENPIAGDEGIIQNSYDISSVPLINTNIVIKIKEILFKLPGLIPLWGLLFSIGAFVWLMILAMGIVLCGQKQIILLCILPSFLYLLTVFLAIPVGCEFRYGYEFIVCSPLYIFAALFYRICNE